MKLKNTLNEIIKERNRIIRHGLPVTRAAVKQVRIDEGKDTLFCYSMKYHLTEDQIKYKEFAEMRVRRRKPQKKVEKSEGS